MTQIKLYKHLVRTNFANIKTKIDAEIKPKKQKTKTRRVYK